MNDHFTLFELPEPIDNIDKESIHRAKPRLNVARRNQIEFKIASLDDLVPQDHTVRLVWDYVNQLDMSNILGTIQSVEGGVGRPATDPKILLALWLYATLEGIVSARVITDYCSEHLAYQWICGDVKINNHTLSDFSVKYGQQFDEFLIQSVAILIKQGSVDLEEVSQDGMRVRASAGDSSFRREKSLLACHEEARQYLEKLRKELKDNPAANRSKKEAAALRAAKEREKRVKNALEELKKLEEEKKKNSHKGAKKLKEILANARASITDPEARKMKMACGGFRPAYNIQFATTKKGRAIIGVNIINRGNDNGSILSMIEKTHKDYGITPSRWLVDCGYADYQEISRVAELYKGCKIYMPPKMSRIPTDPHKILPTDTVGIIELRHRMNTDEAKHIYKGRGSTAEFSNAQCRNKGLQQFFVRGLRRIKAVTIRFALTHNMQRFFGMKMITV